MRPLDDKEAVCAGDAGGCAVSTALIVAGGALCLPLIFALMWALSPAEKNEEWWCD